MTWKHDGTILLFLGLWWDGNRLLFTIEAEGKRIPCAISRSALQNLSGHTRLAASDALHRFTDSRDRIEEIAARIFHNTPEWVSGPVSIWADDIDNLPSARALVPREVVPFTGCSRGRFTEHSGHPDLIDGDAY